MLRVSPVPAFADNYIWVLHDSTHALVVDPGDAAPVQAFLAEHQLTLAGVLITHGHIDHIGGVSALRTDWPEAPVSAGPVVSCQNSLCFSEVAAMLVLLGKAVNP